MANYNIIPMLTVGTRLASALHESSTLSSAQKRFWMSFVSHQCEPRWFIGIPIMAYHNPYNWVGFHPLYNLSNQGFFHCSCGVICIYHMYSVQYIKTALRYVDSIYSSAFWQIPSKNPDSPLLLINWNPQQPRFVTDGKW